MKKLTFALLAASSVLFPMTVSATSLVKLDTTIDEVKKQCNGETSCTTHCSPTSPTTHCTYGCQGTNCTVTIYGKKGVKTNRVSSEGKRS
jgi:hypothetical protein